MGFGISSFWPWRRQWHPTPVLLPGKSHGWRSLVGYSPWGREESNTTERLHFYFSLSCTGEGNGNPLQCSCLENPRDGGAWWLPSMGSHRVGHDWSDLAAAAAFWPPEHWDFSSLHHSEAMWRFPLISYLCVPQFPHLEDGYFFLRLNGTPLQYSCLEKSHGRRGLVGCSPWSC